MNAPYSQDKETVVIRLEREKKGGVTDEFAEKKEELRFGSNLNLVVLCRLGKTRERLQSGKLEAQKIEKEE